MFRLSVVLGLVLTSCGPRPRVQSYPMQLAEQRPASGIFVEHGGSYWIPPPQCLCSRSNGGAEEARLGGGADEARLGGGAEEARRGGGAEETRHGGGAEEARRGGGAEEARRGGGAEEARLGGGADEARRGGGAAGDLRCQAPPDCETVMLETGVTLRHQEGN